MKLDNFLYSIYAQAEGPWFRVILANSNIRHSFLACELSSPQHQTLGQFHGIVVFSPEIAELQEQGLGRKAEELRGFFIGVFRCHGASIRRATARTADLVKAYSNEAE
jgi:hypothetical protein